MFPHQEQVLSCVSPRSPPLGDPAGRASPARPGPLARGPPKPFIGLPARAGRRRLGGGELCPGSSGSRPAPLRGLVGGRGRPLRGRAPGAPAQPLARGWWEERGAGVGRGCAARTRRLAPGPAAPEASARPAELVRARNRGRDGGRAAGHLPPRARGRASGGGASS